MIRWYDYIAAFMVADVTASLFFGIPIVGGIIAYFLATFGWDSYCEWRKDMEDIQ